MKNIGSLDRILRLILGIVILGLGIYFQSWWGLLGLIPLGTAMVRVCPLYLPFGIRTFKTTKTQSSEAGPEGS